MGILTSVWSHCSLINETSSSCLIIYLVDRLHQFFTDTGSIALVGFIKSRLNRDFHSYIDRPEPLI